MNHEIVRHPHAPGEDTDATDSDLCLDVAAGEGVDPRTFSPLALAEIGDERVTLFQSQVFGVALQLPEQPLPAHARSLIPLWTPGLPVNPDSLQTHVNVIKRRQTDQSGGIVT